MENGKFSALTSMKMNIRFYDRITSVELIKTVLSYKILQKFTDDPQINEANKFSIYFLMRECPSVRV